MEIAKTTQKRTSRVKYAAWFAVLEMACIFTNIALIIKDQITFTAEDYLTPVPIPTLIPLVSLVLLIALLIVSTIQSQNVEKEDELAKLNRYKAGYLSKYVCIPIIIGAMWIMKDFSFIFTGDFFDDMRLPLILFMFGLFVENIIFIILEKTNLE